MKVKVIKKFKDKHLKDKNGKPVIHKVDAILDITEERFAEIQAVEKEKGKLVEPVEEPAAEEAAEPVEEPAAEAKKKTAKKKKSDE